MKKRNSFGGKVVRITVIQHTVQLAVLKYTVLLFFCHSFLPFAVFVLVSLFSCSSSQLHQSRWCILKMIIHWDWSFCSWTRPGEPHHPRCIRQEQKEWRGEERREARIPLSYNKEHSQIFSTPPPQPPAPPPPPLSSHRLRQPLNLLLVNVARCSSHLGRERDALTHIDHSLFTAVVNSHNLC